MLCTNFSKNKYVKKQIKIVFKWANLWGMQVDWNMSHLWEIWQTLIDRFTICFQSLTSQNWAYDSLQYSIYLSVSRYLLSLDFLRGEPNSLLKVYHTTSLSESPPDSIEAVAVWFLESTRERIYERERDKDCA